MIVIRFFWRSFKNIRKYNIVVIKKTRFRNSIFIDKLGFFYLHKTKKNVKYLFLHKNKIKYWLYNGAIPSLSVYKYFKKFNILF